MDGGNGQQGKDVYIYVAPFIQWSLRLPPSKVLGPYGDVVAWRLGIEVMFWMCLALMGSIINLHIFSK